MDKLIIRYAAELQDIYDNQSAGSYTFEGVLAEFARSHRDLMIVTEREG